MNINLTNSEAMKLNILCVEIPTMFSVGELLRVSLIGEYAGDPDEGMKNVMHCLTKELSKHHEIMQLSIEDAKYRVFRDPRISFLSPNFLAKIKKFQPQVIHYIPFSGLTFFCFMRAKVIAHYARNAKIVISCLQPPRDYSYLSKKMISTLKPDLILVQSRKTTRILKNLGMRTRFLPNGVDIKKFIPVSEKTKEKMRKKYELDNRFIILHVGHINNARNVRILGDLAEGDDSVIIVGSTSTKADKDLIKYLKKKGGIVWLRYFENIHEIYGLSDCYIFPTIREFSSIEIPLSILEAMACNLPVISTRFGGLVDIIEEGDGFYFFNEFYEAKNKIEEVRNGVEVKTRKKVLPYSWENVISELDKIYRELDSGRIYDA